MTPGENCPRCGTEWGSGGIGTAAMIAELKAENERLRRENAKLTARCNRMCCSAKIEDVAWRPK